MPLIACHDCDLLQRPCALPPGGKARCARCGAVLYHNTPHSIDRTMALTIAALITYVIANVFPIVIISAEGRQTSATLFSSVVEMWNRDMHLVASLVFLTAIALPAVSILAMAYLLVRARWGRPPDHLVTVVRLIQTVKPWAMIEVLMLGVLVSIVKLGAYARVSLAPALWAIAMLLVITAAISSVFDPHEIWARIDQSRAGFSLSPGLPPLPTQAESHPERGIIPGHWEVER